MYLHDVMMQAQAALCPKTLNQKSSVILTVMSTTKRFCTGISNFSVSGAFRDFILVYYVSIAKEKKRLKFLCSVYTYYWPGL
jgi:hypothetical protein